MELSGKRIAVLAEDLYQDLELWYPVLRMREAGAEVFVVGPEVRTFTSKYGYPAEADKGAKNVRGSEFDAVIVPGGYAPDRMRRHKPMVDLVRTAFTKGKVVAAICHGGWMLVSADILHGKKVTGFIAIRDDLVNAGATYVDAEVVVDGNLVTSRKPEDLPAFCRAIFERLTAGESRARLRKSA